MPKAFASRTASTRLRTPHVKSVNRATPMQIVQMERAGIRGIFLKDLSKRMNIASSRLYAMLGLPKATAEKKAASGAVIAGSSGQSAIGMIRLLGLCENIVENSTAKEAQGFDAAKWLGAWLERPQASLGGQKPADLMDTSTGVQIVARLLGSIESGSYQ
jgi:putative toxin-antitoxin system antitoxin component (TIGR02293 family)